MRKTKKIALYGILTGILVISKELLAFLPNIELVTFLIMMYALFLDVGGILFICFGFCLVQMVLYGVGMWTIGYVFIWPLIGLVTFYFRRYLSKNYLRMAVLALFFGLSFGFLSAIPYFAVSITAGWGYFIRGLLFDIIHGVGNFILMILLFDPLYPVLKHLFIKF